MGEENQQDTDSYHDSDASDSDEQELPEEKNSSVTQLECSVVPASTPDVETKETEKHFQNGQRRHSFLETENNKRKTGEIRTVEPGVGRGASGVSRNDKQTQEKSVNVDLKCASSIPVTKSLTDLRNAAVNIPFSCSGQQYPDTNKGNVNRVGQGPNGLLNRRCVLNPRDQGLLPTNTDLNVGRNVADPLPNPNLVANDCPCYDNIVNEYRANQAAVESEANAAQNFAAEEHLDVQYLVPQQRTPVTYGSNAEDFQHVQYLVPQQRTPVAYGSNAEDFQHVEYLVPQQRTPVAYGSNAEDFQHKVEERKRKARLMLTYLSQDINGLLSETHIEQIIDLFVQFEGRKQIVRLSLTNLSFEMLGTLSETLIARILDIFDCLYERVEVRNENACQPCFVQPTD